MLLAIHRYHISVSRETYHTIDGTNLYPSCGFVYLRMFFYILMRVPGLSFNVNDSFLFVLVIKCSFGV